MLKWWKIFVLLSLGNLFFKMSPSMPCSLLVFAMALNLCLDVFTLAPVTKSAKFKPWVGRRKVPAPNASDHILGVAIFRRQYECAEKCTHVIKCGVVNFNTLTKVCEHLSEDVLQNDTLQTASDWVFVEITWMSMTVNGKCERVLFARRACYSWGCVGCMFWPCLFCG